MRLHQTQQSCPSFCAGPAVCLPPRLPTRNQVHAAVKVLFRHPENPTALYGSRDSRFGMLPTPARKNGPHQCICVFQALSYQRPTGPAMQHIAAGISPWCALLTRSPLGAPAVLWRCPCTPKAAIPKCLLGAVAGSPGYICSESKALRPLLRRLRDAQVRAGTPLVGALLLTWMKVLKQSSDPFHELCMQQHMRALCKALLPGALDCSRRHAR